MVGYPWCLCCRLCLGLFADLFVKQESCETIVVRKKRCWKCILAVVLWRLDCSSSAASCPNFSARLVDVVVNAAKRLNFASSGIWEYWLLYARKSA